jgi:hypothetical protein
VCSLLHHLSVAEASDHVSCSDGGQAVGDHYCGAARSGLWEWEETILPSFVPNHFFHYVFIFTEMDSNRISWIHSDS